MSDLKELAKEYAALVPDWPNLGMRCVDPETGWEYCAIGKDGESLFWTGWGVGCPHRDQFYTGIYGDAGPIELRRAISAGPDLTDACTLGGLLLGLPDARLDMHDNMWSGRTWVVWPTRGENGVNGKTRAEAVIRACIAQAKAVTP